MWFSGSRNGKRGSGGAPGEDGPGRLPVPSRIVPAHNGALTRSSRGLEEFFGHIHGLSGLTLLDLGGATQQNVSFITDLGHRLYSENFLQILKESAGGEAVADQSNPGTIDYFLRQALDYPEGHFDGVLVWDVLGVRLAPALLTAGGTACIRWCGRAAICWHSSTLTISWKRSRTILFAFRT